MPPHLVARCRCSVDRLRPMSSHVRVHSQALSGSPNADRREPHARNHERHSLTLCSWMRAPASRGRQTLINLLSPNWATGVDQTLLHRLNAHYYDREFRVVLSLHGVDLNGLRPDSRPDTSSGRSRPVFKPRGHVLPSPRSARRPPDVEETLCLCQGDIQLRVGIAKLYNQPRRAPHLRPTFRQTKLGWSP